MNYIPTELNEKQSNLDEKKFKAFSKTKNYINIFILLITTLLVIFISLVLKFKDTNSTDSENIINDLPQQNQFPFSFNLEKDRTQIGIENATIVMLVRNFELEGALSSMRYLEDRFNKRYKYPWTFLNDVPFTKEFKKYTTNMASGKTEYGLIPSKEWNKPDFINTTLMYQNFKKMVKDDVIYGGSLSYRNMCKFNSGYFFRQNLTNQYRYYFRVEPDVEHLCDFRYDPFTFMRENNKAYGFVMTFYEYEDTIKTLWNVTMDFFKKHPNYMPKDNSYKFITDKKTFIGEINPPSNSDYNLCHFWSNFEIGDMDFYRSKEYLDYFEYLEKSGGFYYERWGDAPVHSLAVSLLLPTNRVHHFSDLGYYHPPFQRCPYDEKFYESGACVCRADRDNFDVIPHSCLPRWWRVAGKPFLKV